MILGLASYKFAFFVLGITTSTAVTRTQACENLKTLYESNVDGVGAAMRDFEQCMSAAAGGDSCPTESHEVVAAREELQAVFADYLKICGSRVAETPERSDRFYLSAR